MRLRHYASDTLRRTAAEPDNYANMRLFSQPTFRGGWEIWLQCQSFAKLPDSHYYEYQREVPYRPGHGGPRCDFRIRRANANLITLWVELKVLLADDIPDLIDRFASDVGKIQSLNLDADHNSVGAVAVAPLHCKQLFAKQNKERFGELTDVGLSEIDYLAIKPGSPIVASTWNLSGNLHEFDDDYIVVLSYQMI